MRIGLFLFFILLFGGFTTDPPCSCNLLLYKNWDENISMKKIEKEYKKRRSSNPNKRALDRGNILFLKAFKYMKEGKDSLANEWFFMATQHYYYQECRMKDPYHTEKIMKAGMASYFRGDYKNAIFHFEHYFRLGRLPTNCPEIFYIESLKHINPGINVDSVIHAIASDNSHKLEELKGCKGL